MASPGTHTATKPLTPTTNNKLNHPSSIADRRRSTNLKRLNPIKDRRSRAFAPTAISPKSPVLAMAEEQAEGENINEHAAGQDHGGEVEKDVVSLV